MSNLTDELLERIAKSPHNCYGYEGRAMAAELLEWRAKAKEAAAKAKAAAASAAAQGSFGFFGAHVPPPQPPAPTTPDPGLPFYP